MKVTYITHESFLDHSYTIIKELQKHIELKVFIQAKKLNPELENWCKELNAQYIKRLRFRNPTSFITEVQNLKKIKATKAERFLFNTLTAYQSLLIKKFINDPMIMMHDVEIHPGITDRYALYAQRSTLKKFQDKICTASYTQAEIFRQLYGKTSKVFRLPVIDYYTFFAGSENVFNKREETELKKKIKFFFFGTIENYKGIDILLGAAKILNDRNVNFELNIHGKLKKENHIIGERINGLNNVNLYNNFVDHRDIFKIYRDNDVLVLPYRQVTQCGPLLIGYNQNVPAVCSDLPGFREYVDNDKSGWLFNNTAEGLADKMETIVNNPSKIVEMRKYIAGEIMNKFSMKALHKDYIEILKK